MQVQTFFPGFEQPKRTAVLPRLAKAAAHPASLWRTFTRRPLRPADILIVLAHPDDEVFLSGTAALLRAKGYSVQFVYATRGEAGVDLSGQGLSRSALGRQRPKEAVDAIKALGWMRPPVFLEYPDNQLPELESELRAELENIVRQVRPRLVLTFGPDGITKHPDHVTVGAVTDAVAKSAGLGREVYHMALSPASFERIQDAFGRPLTNGWQHVTYVPEDQIRVRVDIREALEKKLRGIAAYETQLLPQLDAFRAYHGIQVPGFKVHNTPPVEEFTRLEA